MIEREQDRNRVESHRVWQTLRAAEPRLDDVARARMLAGIRQRLAETAEEPLTVPTHSRAVWLLGTAALVATAAAVILAWTNMTGDRRRGLAEVAPEQGRAIIVPYLYEGDASYPLDRPVEALSLSADAVVRARLGDAGRLTVRGPAALVVAEHVPASDSGREGGRVSGVTRLRLDRGVLVVDYQRGSARTLAVETADALVLVTGTLFAVEAAPGMPTRVSVYRGTVVAGPPGHARVPISAGQSWHVGEGAAGSVDEDARALMVEHDGAPQPPAPPGGTLRIEGTPRGAEAWLGEQRLGHTPLVAHLAAGEAELRITAPGFRDVMLRAEVRAGEASSVAHGLAPEAAQMPGTDDFTGRSFSKGSQPGRGQATAPALRTAEGLYRAAEAAIARGERARVQELLLTLIQRHPDADLVDVALYELGRLAFEDGDLAAARRYTGQVLARDRDPVFREPAAYLRCRVELAAGADGGAVTCLGSFRQRYPQSAHDAAALALLAALQHGRGRCDLATPLLDEYLRRYPAGPFAAEASERRQRCQRQ